MKRLTIKVTVGERRLHWVVQWSPETGEHDFVFRPDVLGPMVQNELARLIKEEKATIEECRKATEMSRAAAVGFIAEVAARKPDKSHTALCDRDTMEALVSHTLVDGLCRLAVKDAVAKGNK